MAPKKVGKMRVAPAVTVPERGPVPVTLLSGFLGSGKTTLLEHILRNKEGIRCAVVVNDMAEVNIDANLVKGTRLLQTKEKLVELHNGCICCTLREDLLLELRKLALSNQFDVIVIESTGISEPMQVAETFFIDLKDGQGLLNNVARLDNCVTVVDASSFYDNLRSLESVSEKYAAEDVAEEDDRNISHLLVDQVEFANLVLLNKVDLVDDARVEQTTALLRKLNPTATIVPTRSSNVDLQLLLFTDQFKKEYAERAKGWMADIELGVKHVPETLEYGIGSFIYRASVPFHPKRLYDFVVKYMMLQEYEGAPEEEPPAAAAAAAAAPEPTQQSAAEKEAEQAEKRRIQAMNTERHQARLRDLGNLFRSKGYVWLGSPSRLGSFGEWNHAGNMLSFTCGGGWGMFPEAQVSIAGEGQKFIEKTPCQEIVMIGQDLKRDDITRMLNECLLTPEEQAQLQTVMETEKDANELLMFEDPFETWLLEEAEDDWIDEEDEQGDGDE